MYEDYFKSVIGGNFSSPEYYAPTYEAIQVNSLPGYNYSTSNSEKVDDNLKELYPDIYNIVSPMIDKIVLEKNIVKIDEKKLNEITLEIYEALEVDDNTVLVNNKPINSKPSNISTSTNINNRNIQNNKIVPTQNNIVETSKVEGPKIIDVNTRCRNCKNPLLRDLIKILILNRILGNNRNTWNYQNNDFNRPIYNIPNYREVSKEVFKPYTNYSKTYFDTPYPEEG